MPLDNLVNQVYQNVYGEEPNSGKIDQFNKISSAVVSQGITTPDQFDMSAFTTQPEFKQPPTPEPTATAPAPSELAEQIRLQTESLFKPSEEQTRLENQGSALQKQILENVKALGGQQAEQQRLNQQEGVTALTEDLTRLASQVQALDLASSAQQIQIAGQEGGISKGIVQGQLTRAQRDKAVQSLQLAAQASVLQGNLSLAQQRVQQALDVKYEPLKQELQLLQTALEFNYKDLSRADQKRADQLQIQLQERNRLLDEQKQQEQDINQIMLGAAKNGADQPTLNAIQKSKSVAEAIKSSGDFLKDRAQENWTIWDDGDGNVKMYDRNTGNIRDVETKKTYQPTSDGTVVQVDDGVAEDYFTDASGISWNITGWAADPTKAQQMQNIADKIGKVTEENIDAKVAQFTPGLTADMIRAASERTGVSWEALMAMVNQEANGGLSNVAKKNNNFGGLTWNNQEWIKEFGGTKGTQRPAAEGGNYISFPTKQDGLNAMASLMASYGTVVQPEQVEDPEVVAYATLVSNDPNYTKDKALDDIDKEKRGALAQKLAEIPVPTDDRYTELAKSQLRNINMALSSEGFDRAVGVRAIERWTPFKADKADLISFVSSVEQLIDQKTIETLVEAKKNGATFGALTEKELALLQTSASKIANWRIVDKNGKVIGYEVGEQEMEDELILLKSVIEKGLRNQVSNTIKETDDGKMWSINPNGTITELKR